MTSYTVWGASNSSSTSNVVYSDTSGTACDNSHYWHVNANSQSTANWNGWWIEGHDAASGEHYRLQFAHYPTAFPRYKVSKVVNMGIDSLIATTGESGTYVTHMPEILTVEYAPLEEMREVEPRKFDEYLERLRTDPAYRRQQLEQQDRLFLSQKMLGMWTIDGFNLLHRFMEHHREMYRISDIRDITNHLYEHRELARDINGAMATEFMGVPARWEELESLHELFQRHPVELITEVYQKRRDMLLAHDALRTHVQEFTDEELKAKLPPLTVEQLHTISSNAERLLREVLTPAEYDGLIKDGHVRIPSQQDPEVVYIIKRCPTERIEVHRRGKLEEKLCILFKEKLPDDDVTLTKIMMAKHSEAELLEVANHFKVEMTPDHRQYNDVLAHHNQDMNMGARVTPPIEVRT
jgi:hypothetical protein